MPLTSIWERYFLRQISKLFALFLIGFFSLYALIDYSNHSRSFQNYHFKIYEVISFYAFEFVTRMYVLVPFAILIASIKTLCTLNRNNELVALMASGITLKRLLLPFVAFGLIFTGVIYFNTEVLQPRSLKYHRQLDHTRAKAKQKKHHHEMIQQLILEDNSLLVFQSYDEIAGQFIDAYWVKSINDIYRMHALSPHSAEPLGTFVEHLQRNSQEALIVSEVFTSKAFPEMHFNKQTLIESITSPDSQSLSALSEKLPSHGRTLSEKEAILMTTYYYKLAIPWLCLLAIIAPAPFCTRFSRTFPVFIIYALGIFGLVAFYILMDAAATFGERQVVSPAVAIWVPFAFIFTIFGWRFVRI